MILNNNLMRITVVFFLGFILMLFFSFFVLAVGVDQEVLDSLNETGVVDVIVVLIDSDDDVNIADGNSKAERISRLKARGINYLDIQDKILSNLDINDFKLRHKFQIINGFSGDITVVGFNQ